MTNEIILRKAIEKAVKGGWINNYTPIEQIPLWEHHFNLLYSIIFSHEFAKAFWGETDTGGDECKSCGYNGCYKVWKYHLSKMVLEIEPLKYLEKFL